jgi:hypothetical protein
MPPNALGDLPFPASVVNTAAPMRLAAETEEGAISTRNEETLGCARRCPPAHDSRALALLARSESQAKRTRLEVARLLLQVNPRILSV